LIETGFYLAYLFTVTDDGNISFVRDVEEQAFQCYVSVGNGFEFFRVPEGVLLPFIFEIFAEFYIVIEVFKCMLESILENIGVPVIGPSLVTVDYMNEDF
jgi:hypothetical protein